MGNCIRTEMWKAFHNKMMRSALLIGFILVIADLVQTAITVSDLGASYAHSPGGYDGCSLFVNWIGVNGVTVGAVVFYAVWPFLAAMPYGWSLYEDNRSHMTNNILTRVPYSQYLTAKMAAVFVSGGIAIALPVTADLFASAMICPACIPRVTLPITVRVQPFWRSYTILTLGCMQSSGVLLSFSGAALLPVCALSSDIR